MAIRRGFTDEIEMNDLIISNWNKTVNKKDVTIILGDITMEKANYDILNCLNGIILSFSMLLELSDLIQFHLSLLLVLNKEDIVNTLEML